jgi:hypothetical protein
VYYGNHKNVKYNSCRPYCHHGLSAMPSHTQKHCITCVTSAVWAMRALSHTATWEPKNYRVWLTSVQAFHWRGATDTFSGEICLGQMLQQQTRYTYRKSRGSRGNDSVRTTVLDHNNEVGFDCHTEQLSSTPLVKWKACMGKSLW